MSIFGLTPLGSPEVPCFVEFMPLFSFLAVGIVTCSWESLQFQRILKTRVNAGVVHDRMYVFHNAVYEIPNGVICCLPSVFTTPL
jgi:hypothetical protein